MHQMFAPLPSAPIFLHTVHTVPQTPRHSRSKSYLCHRSLSLLPVPQGPEVVGAHWGMVDPEMATLLADHGKLLFTWTVNEVLVQSAYMDVCADACMQASHEAEASHATMQFSLACTNGHYVQHHHCGPGLVRVPVLHACHTCTLQAWVMAQVLDAGVDAIVTNEVAMAQARALALAPLLTPPSCIFF